MSYTAAQVQQILKTVDLFILPVINPDGRIYSMYPAQQGGDLLRRRNRNKPRVNVTVITIFGGISDRILIHHGGRNCGE